MFATLLASAFAPALAEDVATDHGTDAERRIVIRQSTLALPPGQQAAALRVSENTGLVGAMFGISGSGIVKDAPYSAEAVSESVQRLADGNQIVNRSSSMQYRDSAGRTRTEVRDGEGTLRTVIINDPVAGARWVLNPQRKSATRIAITPRTSRPDAQAARATAAAQSRGAMVQARERIGQLRGQDARPEGTAIVKEVQRGADAAEVRVLVAEAALGAQPAARAMSARIAPLILGAANDGKWSARTVTRELGERDVAGVRAQGSQRSYTIPADAIGNRDPIEVSSETWYSPELQVTLRHTRSDPRSGDIVYKLENLSRGEPPATLFSVPPDYTVRDPLAAVSVMRQGQVPASDEK